MEYCHDIYIMKEFPDFNVHGFDIENYNERFRKKNVLIHASSSDIFYPEHWGCLSVKCAFNGNEHYESNGRRYAVNNGNYLIFNEGQNYSSYIFSKLPVESFTINFSHSFQQTVISSLFDSFDNMQQDCDSKKQVDFIEKLYVHDNIVSPVLWNLYKLSSVAKPDHILINEKYYLLLEKLLLLQKQVYREIKKVKASKYSTQKELYRRLYYAKDFIDSCYMSEITLEKLAGLACLNSAYFLRQFREYFHVTPYQYIIRQRLKAAAHMLETTSHSVTEICFAVGYGDLTSFIKLFKQHLKLSPEKYQYTYGKKSFFTC